MNSGLRATVPRLMLAAGVVLLTGACAAETPGTESGAAVREECSAPEARAIVEELGRRLARVSLQAPDTTVARQIREAYSAVVTERLLSEWTTEPHAAPGREVSSPWPARIEVLHIAPDGAGGCRVEGEIVLVTSVEAARGGDAGRERVRLRVTRAPGGWRVAEVTIER